jgi:hypothetical protein
MITRRSVLSSLALGAASIVAGARLTARPSEAAKRNHPNKHEHRMNHRRAQRRRRG